jgi:L-fucose isomerase
MSEFNGKKRLIGAMPKIGIRPTIDGRERGVRESLEAQTMGLAESVAELLESTLRHPNGLPVECVIADSTIGGVAEAAAAEEKFQRDGVGVSLTVTPAWCYGTETIDQNSLRPKAIWGFNGSERPGAVYLAAAAAGHNQKGLPVFKIYGENVQDAGTESIPEDVKEKILKFAKAGLAAATMRGKSYLSMGGVSMGIAGSIVDEEVFQDYLGMRNEYIDMSEFTRRIEEEIYDQEEFEKALAWVKENCNEGQDNNPESEQFSREEKNEQWEFIVKMTIIARDLMVGNPKQQC